MRRDLYRKVMFVISMVCLILLIVIAIKIDAFAEISACIVFKIAMSIIQNSYFSSIVCSILAVLIIYFAQVYYSKKMLKKDFRCNEIIEDIYNGIELYCNMADKVPKRSEIEQDEDVGEKRKRESIIFYKFYKENKADINIITLSLSYRNNDILIDSLQSCFFINLNFKLLNIINNIKNRLPNIREKYPMIEEAYKEYELENGEKELLELGNQLRLYFIDLRFMAMYWKYLLDYLEYDPTYIKLFIQAYKAKYTFEEDIKQPVEIRNMRAREVDKMVKKVLWKSKIEHFWRR